MRIGPKMMIVLEAVRESPGAPKISAACAAMPYPWKGRRGGLAYGYRSVDRAIASGLVDAARASGRAWSLTLTEAGRQALAGKQAPCSSS
jgi:hypothetical protein